MKFLVKQQKIEALEREVIASDQIAFILLVGKLHTFLHQKYIQKMLDINRQGTELL